MNKVAFLIIIFAGTATTLMGQAENVVVQEQKGNWVLTIDSEPVFIKGINWGHQPIGSTYTYSLWEQEPDSIQRVLDRQMSMLSNAGVNAIRVYTGIQQEWIRYIYEEYGIYTMLNHSFGRYGMEIEGQWDPNTDYAHPEVRAKLLKETAQLAEDFRGTPGLLMYLLGNENNYGLFWAGAETEDIPEEIDGAALQARAMYKLFNEAAQSMKGIDGNVPVALCNGDLQFLDIISEEASDIDILGVNVYRGASFTDLYTKAKEVYGKPVLLTEFGSDAFNMKTMSEDQAAQAHFIKENWREIFMHASGMSGAGNSIGGFTFQFVDGWWKYDQSKNLNVHDTIASWANGGYEFDYTEGQNNMNEEWFGVVSWIQDPKSGKYTLDPRAAFYVLSEAHKFDPYSKDADPESLSKHFKELSIDAALKKALSE